MGENGAEITLWRTIIVVIKCRCIWAIVLRDVERKRGCVIVGKTLKPRVDMLRKVIQSMLGKYEL